MYFTIVTTPCLFLILSCVFQRVLELEVAAVEHQFVFIDEVGFNLTKRGRRGRNIIGQRAIIEVPGLRGGNITMCAAITHHGVIHHHATLGPYNTAHLITFLDTLHNTLIPPDQIDGPEQLRYVVIWDNVSFHRAALVHNWFIPGSLVSLHTPLSSILSRNFFLPGDGKCMTEIHKHTIPFSKLWKTHVERFQRMLSMAGFTMLGDISPAAWPDKTSHVM